MIAFVAVTACSPPAPVPTYAVDAAGRPAVVADRTTIRWPQGMPSGLIRGVEICGNYAYLCDQLHVRVVDFAAGRVIGQIGRQGDGPGELRRPRALGVDCRRGRLYVGEDPSGITVFSVPEGEYLQRHAQPPASVSTQNRPLVGG